MVALVALVLVLPTSIIGIIGITNMINSTSGIIGITNMIKSTSGIIGIICIGCISTTIYIPS